MSNIHLLSSAVSPAAQVHNTLEKAVSAAICAMDDAQVTSLMKSPINELIAESHPIALAA